MGTAVRALRLNSEEHVKWLSRMVDIAETMNTDKPGDIITETNKNPMKIKLEARDALDWPHIHFCLFAVYAKAVLRGRGWIPVARTSP